MTVHEQCSRATIVLGQTSLQQLLVFCGLDLSLFEAWSTMAFEVKLAEECAHIYKALVWIILSIQTCFALTTVSVLEELRAHSAGLEADLQNCHLLFYSYTLAAVVFKIYCPCMLILGDLFCVTWPPLLWTGY